MFITNEDLQNRLDRTEALLGLPSVPVNSESNSNSELVEEDQADTSNLTVLPLPPRGRSKGAKNIPDFLRPVIGAVAVVSGPTETAKEFGVSVATASNYAHGIIPNGDTTVQNTELKSKVDQLVGQAQEKAAEKLMSALGFITDEKLEGAKAGDLSRIAADMSRVIEKTTEKKNFSGAQIVIYAPQLREENKFEIIES